jgi:hypothetical protein
MIETDLGEGPGGFGQPRPIGLFAPSADPGTPFVAVNVARLPIEVNLADWVDFLCRQDGWSPFASRWWRTPNGLFVDVGATRAQPPPGDVMRVMAHADNGRIFQVAGVAPRTQWDRWKDHLLVACSSFKLKVATGDDSLEPMLQWEGGDPGFGFAFPATWSATPKPPSVPGKSATDVKLADGEQLIAYMLVKATSRLAHPEATPELLVAQARSELERGGFRATGAPTRAPSDDPGEKRSGWSGTSVLPGRMWDRAVETRIGVKMLPGIAISISLVAVDKEANPLLWMRSKRAFEIVRDHCWSSQRERSP